MRAFACPFLPVPRLRPEPDTHSVFPSVKIHPSDQQGRQTKVTLLLDLIIDTEGLQQAHSVVERLCCFRNQIRDVIYLVLALQYTFV